jgi:hypothetical protein
LGYFGYFYNFCRNRDGVRSEANVSNVVKTKEAT